MNIEFAPIAIPLLIGFLQLLIPARYRAVHAWILTTAVSVNFLVTLALFFFLPRYADAFWRVDNFAAFILLGIGFFGLLIPLYSLRFFPREFNFKGFAAYTLWTLGAAAGIVLSNNLILFTLFWGFVALTLYLLVNLVPGASPAAKKMFVIVGGTDALLILGIALVSNLRGNWIIFEKALPMSPTGIAAFLCLTLAALAKAGALPVHTWIPDVAEKAPVPVTALLPAALDKFLGIYLLIRIVTNIFIPNAFTSWFLLVIGAATIIVAVMMTLVQNDIKRFLGYNTVSQVGYMVVGIGTGTMLGVIGGIFHMLNHTFYEATLFMAAGSVEKQTGTADLRNLGGLSRLMPITFASTVVAIMALSGIPPLNGFVSKWLIYQSLMQSFSTSGSWLALLVLLATLFGSALTLAACIRFLHAAFLTSPKLSVAAVREIPWTMWLPMVVLSALCIVFGVFAFQLPVPYLVANSVAFNYDFSGGFLGFWQPGIATALVLAGLAIGLAVYFIFMRAHSFRTDSAFVGGENIPGETYPPGTDFYKTIQDFGVFKALYAAAQKKLFDIYDLGNGFITFTGGLLSRAQSGILSTYLLWCLIGLVALFWFML